MSKPIDYGKKHFLVPIPPILPDINDWPIFKLSEDRKTFTEELEHFTLDKIEHFHKENLTDLIAETIYLEK